MSLQFNDNINVKSPKDINDKTGVFESGVWRPWNDLTEALNSSKLLPAYRNVGLTIYVLKSGVLTEYWFRNGITNSDLIEKNAPVSLPTLQQVTDQGNVSSNVIQITGLVNADLDIVSTIISNNGVAQINPAFSLGVSGAVEFSTNNTQLYFNTTVGIKSSLVLNEETPLFAGAQFDTRVGIQPGVNPNDAITLSQLEGANFIQNQNATSQVGNFRINGSGEFYTSGTNYTYIDPDGAEFTTGSNTTAISPGNVQVSQGVTYTVLTKDEFYFWNGARKASIKADFTMLPVVDINLTLPKVSGQIALVGDLSAYQLLSQKAQANGYASLDGGGKIPASQLPNSVMELQGSWNASTNTPTLADGTGNPGDVYQVTVAGTQNLGSGSISYAVGDFVIYGSSGVWFKSLNSNAVTSVFSRTGVITAIEADYAAFYPKLSTSYADPSWINSLAYAKITGVPDFALNANVIHTTGNETKNGTLTLISPNGSDGFISQVGNLATAYSYFRVGTSDILVQAYNDGPNAIGSTFQFNRNGTWNIGGSTSLTTERSIRTNAGIFQIVDSIGNKGLEYEGNYEVNFTSKSLVTKLYVDTLVSGWDLQQVTSAGATTTVPITVTGGVFPSVQTIATAINASAFFRASGFDTASGNGGNASINGIGKNANLSLTPIAGGGSATIGVLTNGISLKFNVGSTSSNVSHEMFPDGRMQGASPTNTNDFATKGYVDNNTNALNGLHRDAGVTKLGGLLTENTVIGDINEGGSITIRPISSGSAGVNLLSKNLGTGSFTQSIYNSNAIEFRAWNSSLTGPTLSLSQDNLIHALTLTDPIKMLGAVYGGDFSANNASNPRWIPDKGYVDSKAGNYLPLTGGTLTGNLLGTTSSFSGNVNSQGAFVINRAGAVAKGVFSQTSASNRWFFGANATSESGSNLGSNFVVERYSDAGASLGNALTIERNSGNASFSGNVISSVAPTIGSHLVNKTALDAAVAGYLPLTAGTGFPLTGELQINKSAAGITLKNIAGAVGNTFVQFQNNAGTRLGYVGLPSVGNNNMAITADLAAITYNGTSHIFNSQITGTSAVFTSTVAATANISISDVVGSTRGVFIKTGANNRWSMTATSAAESGSNLGSDLAVIRYNDAGTAIAQALNISRATGAITVESTISSAIAPTTGNHLTNKTYTDGLLAAGLGVNTISAAATLTLTVRGYYTFNGTTTTWTLPALAGSVGTLYRIINMGSGNLTLSAGTNEIYDSGVSSTTFIVGAGTSLSLYNNSLKWIILG